MAGCIIAFEEEILKKTLASFRCYRNFMFGKANSVIKYYGSLSKSQKDLIPDFENNMQQVSLCIETNALVIDLFAESLGNSSFSKNECSSNDNIIPTSQDISKVQSILKQIAREWSSTGAAEREVCFAPVIRAIDNIYEYSQYDSKSDFRVLVPGAGLGRLIWEIAKKGYFCQGNESSLHMLSISKFIMNECSEQNCHKIYPWLSNYCNNPLRANQIESVFFPDVNPTLLPENNKLSLGIGDFEVAYNEKDNWDCVATVFFLDTARNVLQYIELIWDILCPGGHWINMGPLLYHYSDDKEEGSLELSYEEVKKAIELKGFVLKMERYPVESTYTQNTNSMLSNQYKCVFFIVKKPMNIS